MAPKKSDPQQLHLFDDTPIGMLPNGELNVIQEEPEGDFSAANDVPDEE